MRRKDNREREEDIDEMVNYNHRCSRSQTKSPSSRRNTGSIFPENLCPSAITPHSASRSVSASYCASVNPSCV
jgi:hypothetical protein